MKATEAKFLDFLKKSPQFVIPIYQRSYSWTERECRQLWDDIVRAGKNDQVTTHFIGSVVYIQESIYIVSLQSPLLVIDGQQRLTTVSLLIEALAQAIGKSEPFEGFSSRKLRNYYLVNPEEIGEGKNKLILSQTDKDTLVALINQQPLPKDVSIRIRDNFDLFKTWIGDSKDDLAIICKGLAKLVVVDISLTREQDNPQLIFESLNSTGLELSQADLIRNYVLMGLDTELQTRLYLQYWRPIELDFGQEAYVTHFDGFMRHYLTVKTGDIPNLKKVYEAFKTYSQSDQISSLETLLADIKAYAGYYCAMALGAEDDKKLSEVFRDLRELKVDVAFPFLLQLYNDYHHNILVKEDFIEAIRMTESYVFRRAICSIPTNSLNKTFPTLARDINKDKYLEGITANFLLLASYRRFPSDEEFIREILTKDLYNFRSRSYWLRRLENYERKEHVMVDEYTIEHILPQNENLSEAWQNELGADWKRVQETWLHTLGNLTLTGYNPELSDRSFRDKRDMRGGFSDSPIRLNKSLAALDHWNEREIQNRASVLANRAVEVWKAPFLDPNILASYRKAPEKTTYTIDDHPYLTSGKTRKLFDELRKQILSLDPCILEEFLKLYIAYKAETNFVDVVPQASQLRLSLNMPFYEIIDPKGICNDVTDKGRWGNGDVEVKLSSTAELPYIIGLIRQSLERQLGSNGDN